MKIQCYKSGNSLEIHPDYQGKFSWCTDGDLIEIEVKRVRNPAFHRKVFAFFKFCFEHWVEHNSFRDELAQFESFRKQLTILAGYYYEVVDIASGTLRVEAKSLSFGNMDQTEFEQCYSALVDAALEHVFRNYDDAVKDRLMSFI